MDRKTAFILTFLLIIALLVGQNFIQLNKVFANPRGGYTSAEISSAVIVVNGGNIITADYDNLIIRANQPALRISILGSGYERYFNITVNNVNPDSILINGTEPGSLVKGEKYVQFTAVVPPRLVKDITLTPAGNFENFSFAVLGDSRGNPLVFQNILQKTGDFNPQFIIHLGDMVSEGTQEEYGDITRIMNTVKVPVYTAPGNHDIRGGGRSHYSRIFGMYYHSFDLGSAHFILLDNAGGHLGQAQIDWLRNDLEKNNNSLIIICMHMPVFDPREVAPHAMNDAPESEILVSLFRDFNVDAVYAAHIHSYLTYTQDGTYYIISGGGGAPPVQAGDRYHFILTNITDSNFTAAMIEV